MNISVTSYFFYLTTPRCDSLHGPDGGVYAKGDTSQ